LVFDMGRRGFDRMRSPRAAVGLRDGQGAHVADQPNRRGQAAEAFAGEVAAGRVPSVRAIALGCASGSRVRSGYARA